MANGKDGIAICPYYESQNTNAILCECLISKAEDRLHFSSRPNKEMYFNQYCASFSYKKCKRARILSLIHEGALKV